MDIREVRSFLILAEQAHFGRTARRLNLSQPALTKQICRLEEALGGALLVRSRHGAQLTSLGRMFQSKAQEVVRDWDELTATITEVAPSETWVTHGRDEALVHWCAMHQMSARALALVGYEDEDEG